VPKPFSCALGTCKERGCDSFLAPELARLHQRAGVGVRGDLLSSAGCSSSSTRRTGGACAEGCAAGGLSLGESLMFCDTSFYHTASPVSGAGCFSPACEFTDSCVRGPEVAFCPVLQKSSCLSIFTHL